LLRNNLEDWKYACLGGDMLISVLLHIAMVVLLLLLTPSSTGVLREPAKNRILGPRILLSPIPAPSKGGGGSDSVTPPSRGVLPRYAQRQFAPPMIQTENPNPKLEVEPTVLVASADLSVLPAAPIGLPSGMPGPPSGGSGHRGGIGTGIGGGIGDGIGPGVEGLVPQPMRGDIRQPVAIYKVEPEYSEEARKVRVQGTVVVEALIDEKGNTRALRVREGLGYGLDEQAMEAVNHWRFRPATRGGHPIPLVGTFYLTFRLL
jgi:periplasmic protein TonB